MQYLILLSTLVIFLSGIALLLKAADNLSRRYLGILYTLLGALGTLRTVFMPVNIGQAGILTYPQLHEGTLLIIALCLYPLLVVKPGWFSIKRTVLLFSPYVVIIIILTEISRYGITHLGNLSILFDKIGQVDVAGRSIVFCLIQIYIFCICFLPFSLYRTNPQQRRWLYRLAAINIATSISYDIYVLTNTPFSFHANRVCFITMTLYLTIRALRTENPSRLSPEIPRQSASEALPQSLVLRMKQLMDEAQPWHDPELTLTSLASLLNTNRTTLSATIRKEGFISFNEYVNRYRVNEFKRLAAEATDNEATDLTGLWLSAGFRSKSTFYRNFIQCEGITPNSYLLSLKK